MRNDETKDTANLQKSVLPGLEIITLNRESCQEYFMTSVPESNECAESLFQRLAEAVRERKAQIISQEVFGIPDKDGTGMQAVKAVGKGVRTFVVPSPLQYPAMEYGSSFNRRPWGKTPEISTFFALEQKGVE